MQVLKKKKKERLPRIVIIFLRIVLWSRSQCYLHRTDGTVKAQGTYGICARKCSNLRGQLQSLPSVYYSTFAYVGPTCPCSISLKMALKPYIYSHNAAWEQAPNLVSLVLSRTQHTVGAQRVRKQTDPSFHPSTWHAGQVKWSIYKSWQLWISLRNHLYQRETSFPKTFQNGYLTFSPPLLHFWAPNLFLLFWPAFMSVWELGKSARGELLTFP